jgi:transposase
LGWAKPRFEGISAGTMANILKVHEQNAISQLAAQGWSQRRIAHELGLDRKTVRRYLIGEAKSPTISTPGSGPAESSKSPISTPGDCGDCAVVTGALAAEAGRPSLCDPHTERITGKVEAGLSAQRIYQDLRAEVDFAGSYQSVKRFVRRLRHAAPQRVWRVEVEPGEEVQVDFGLGAPVIDADGRRRRPWVLRSVLSYSRKGCSEAVFQQTTENLVRCLENSFRRFGGVTKTLNLDNLRAAVQRADWCDPDLNPKLLAFARHYGVALLPCRPRTPEHKGKTERGISYLKGNALRGRTFPSLAAHNEFLRHWEATVADVRLHGTTRQQVAARFALEQPHLLPLPPDLFPCFREGRRTVHRDSYVEVERAYYAVPPEYIGSDLWVRWDGREVRVFNARWEQVILHARLEPGQFTECLGLGGGHGPLERQLDYWLGRCRALGEPCGQWAQRVLEHKGPIGLRTLMGLIGLSERHGFGALNHACASALGHGAWRLRDVRALLEQRPPQVQSHFAFAQSHPLIRNLAEYGVFIQTQNP